MDSYSAPLDDMNFLLEQVFEVNKTWSSIAAFEDMSIELADSLLSEAGKLATGVLAPLNRSGDEAGCQWNDGVVTTPPGYKEAYATFRNNGWTAVSGDADLGATNLPKSLTVLLDEIFNGANAAFALYPLLSRGAALCLQSHGSEELKQTYLPKLYSGEWSGTMCLTEAQSGSDLNLLTSRAEPAGDGTYRITGNKIFITGGEHDLTDNIVHLVLARLPGAPAGHRGISLFLVPKFLPDSSGEFTKRNNVNCIAIEHKMGIKASATCSLAFEGATGWLVGEEHRGLAAMFTMMNEERLSIGLQGVGLGEASFQQAYAYANERLQGRADSKKADADYQAQPIIQHADVRRMLLTMRAFNEAGRALAVYTGLQIDLTENTEDPQQRSAAAARVALLIPLVKAFFTDRGLETCVLGQQVFGGHGYIRETGVEQYVRDVRIAQIYEGTNGIQAIDLVRRKVAADQGAALFAFIAEMEDWLDENSWNQEQPALAKDLGDAIALLTDVSKHVLENSDSADFISAIACDYLDLLGYVTYAWLWARMMSAANDGSSKVDTGNFYYQRLLPRIHSLAAQIKAEQSWVSASI